MVALLSIVGGVPPSKLTCRIPIRCVARIQRHMLLVHRDGYGGSREIVAPHAYHLHYPARTWISTLDALCCIMCLSGESYESPPSLTILAVYDLVCPITSFDYSGLPNLLCHGLKRVPSQSLPHQGSSITASLRESGAHYDFSHIGYAAPPLAGLLRKVNPPSGFKMFHQ